MKRLDQSTQANHTYQTQVVSAWLPAIEAVGGLQWSGKRIIAHCYVAVSILYLHTGDSLVPARNDLRGWPTLGGPNLGPTWGRLWADLGLTLE